LLNKLSFLKTFSKEGKLFNHNFEFQTYNHLYISKISKSMDECYWNLKCPIGVTKLNNFKSIAKTIFEETPIN
jgi:hypothetical protein